MGPLAGLAAGLGLAALMSHLGLGEAFGSFLLMALLAVAAIFLVRMFLRRKQQQPQPAGMAYTGQGSAPGQVAWPNAAPAPAPAGAAADPVMPAPAQVAPAPEAAVAPVVAAAAPAKAFVPAAFDAEGFARTAKMIFIRLQAANDAADLNDLRAFTTPEMFAELSMDLKDRPAGHHQVTEVVSIESEVLDVTDELTHQVVSVRFRGQVREEAGAAPVAVDEVWHLSKPIDGSRNWAIAGIEQWQAARARRLTRPDDPLECGCPSGRWSCPHGQGSGLAERHARPAGTLAAVPAGSPGQGPAGGAVPEPAVRGAAPVAPPTRRPSRPAPCRFAGPTCRCRISAWRTNSTATARPWTPWPPRCKVAAWCCCTARPASAAPAPPRPACSSGWGWNAAALAAAGA